MTVTKQRYCREDAITVARELHERLHQFCERIIFAGSLRRRKELVGDIEIVYIPRTEERHADLLSTQRVNLVDGELDRILAAGLLTKRPSVTGRTAWGDRNKLALHRSGIPVDLFSTTPDAWYNYLICRTGPAELCARIATAAQQRGYRWNPYGSGFTSLADGSVIAMASEMDVFKFVGMRYLNPWERG